MFASFVENGDTDLLFELGHLDEDASEQIAYDRGIRLEALLEFLRAGEWLDQSAEDIAAISTACHCFLASSPAAGIVINMEDLWQERRPQNVPGTAGEQPNWLRRSRYSLEEFTTMPGIAELLERIDRLRKGIP
jgi:4-alpha-glucanotransferase